MLKIFSALLGLSITISCGDDTTIITTFSTISGPVTNVSVCGGGDVYPTTGDDTGTGTDAESTSTDTTFGTAETTIVPTTSETTSTGSETDDPTGTTSCPRTDFCSTNTCPQGPGFDTQCNALLALCLLWDFPSEFCIEMADRCVELGPSVDDGQACQSMHDWSDKLDLCGSSGDGGIQDECLCLLSCWQR